jgi:hypothetical protein
MPALALALLQTMLPSIIQTTKQIYDAIAADPGTPEEVKAQLAAISAELKSTCDKVAAVQLPNG